MRSSLTPDDLLKFEDGIAKSFARGEILAPIHLADGNEQQLIDIFASIKDDDWVLCAWRAHSHCLLKGVDPGELRRSILRGRSISLCFPEHRVLCSGIVGGIAPIAVGIALGCLAEKRGSKVHAFIGDMTAQTGIVHESMTYAARNRLPVRWIVEDNGKSVCTDTKRSWGLFDNEPDILHYDYTLSRPHSGIGAWVRF